MSSHTHSPMNVSRLLKLAIPLMVSWLSTSIMLFADRFMLSKYSLESLSAAVHAGTFAWAFSFGFQIFTEMAQVLVAQYRGAEKLDKLSHPSWQMIWLSLGSVALFIPLGVWGTALFFKAGTLQFSYFKYLIFFGPFFGLIGASSSYFMGMGKNKVVTYGAIIGNVVNLTLDYLMIFGVSGVLKPMGIKGAALATGIGLVVQAGLMIYWFLKETNYEVIPFCKKLFVKCSKVSLPPAFFMTVELVGWGVFYSLMEMASPKHLLVTSICNTFFPLIVTVNVGLQKAVATESGRLIGANQMDLINPLLKTAVKILSLTYVGLILAFAILPNAVYASLLSSKLDSFNFDQQALQALIRIGLVISSVYLYFGGIRFTIAGTLSAAGDSRFLSIYGGGAIWIGLIAPTFFFINQRAGSVTQAQMILAYYGVVCSILYFLRYRGGLWKAKARMVEEK